jgi:hypothetical protein
MRRDMASLVPPGGNPQMILASSRLAWASADSGQRGAMRSAPSRRITSPFRCPLVTMWQASSANSSGLPRRGRERDGCRQRSLHRLGQLLHQRRGKQARRHGAHPDAVLRQVARHGQRHADQAALGRAVGLLADLAVEGRHRRGEHHHAAFAVVQRGQLHALGGEQAADVVAADQVDVDHPGKVFQRCGDCRPCRRCALAVPMPAMFIRMRAGPWAAVALSSAAVTLSVLVMSHWQAAPLMSAATFSASAM